MIKESETIPSKMAVVRQHLIDWPVDVVAIARALNLQVQRTKSWPADISGQIARDPANPSQYIITINGNHGVKRQRFTVAHEIAHFVLHQPLIGDGIVDDALYRSRLSGRLEVEANDLAADILMPWALINKAMDLGLNTVEDLAQEFNVSKSAMSIRLGVPYETDPDQ